MVKKNRKELKNFFLKGRIPSQEQFHHLIDSTINVLDDGLYYQPGTGLRMRKDENGRLLSFYDSLEDERAQWHVSSQTEENRPGFAITEPASVQGGLRGDATRFFIEKGGNVGIGTDQPKYQLHVNGMVGMKGRIGYFLTGDDKPANGQWHDLITGEGSAGLRDYNAFEIIAYTNVKNNNRAITFATAVTSLNRYWFLGRSKRGIKHNHGFFKRYRNKIDFRWHGTPESYKLQVRTRRNFGSGVFIHYHVTKLL